GVSFTPDIAVHGTVNKLSSTPKAEDQNFKDLFDFGVQYETKFKDFGYKVGATAQHGRSKSLNTPRKDLNIYEVGAIVTYKNASLAGSYSDWGKSATPTVKDPNKKYGAKYWTIGTAYKYEKLDSSLTFFKAYKANVFSANVPATTASHDVSHNSNYYVSLGFDYALVPGLTPYAELTHLHFRNADASRGNRANVLLVGSRLTF
ncbi:MAG: porin, partial [Alphaproteobacteria bacterium]